ncbi:MAG: type II toxin-antitoxin system VapC family toxin [Fibromonadaceae bacterium]|nr:type II toxin-antitoxin system VapC family toxin [Fibromonadaceae bacterium]
MSYILDTNVVIDYIQGNFPDKEATFIENLLFLGIPNISVITEIEVLCWKHANEEDVEQYKKFIENSKIMELCNSVKLKTIDIRRNHKIKLPDALIAATALVHDFELITRNTKDFENIAGLKIKNPWD